MGLVIVHKGSLWTVHKFSRQKKKKIYSSSSRTTTTIFQQPLTPQSQFQQQQQQIYQQQIAPQTQSPEPKIMKNIKLLFRPICALKKVNKD
jgi:hypothetical protein